MVSTSSTDEPELDRRETRARPGDRAGFVVPEGIRWWRRGALARRLETTGAVQGRPGGFETLAGARSSTTGDRSSRTSSVEPVETTPLVGRAGSRPRHSSVERGRDHATRRSSEVETTPLVGRARSRPRHSSVERSRDHATRRSSEVETTPLVGRARSRPRHSSVERSRDHATRRSSEVETTPLVGRARSRPRHSSVERSRDHGSMSPGTSPDFDSPSTASQASRGLARSSFAHAARSVLARCCSLSPSGAAGGGGRPSGRSSRPPGAGRSSGPGPRRCR